jgi:polysaccharide export outer membrane protein
VFALRANRTSLLEALLRAGGLTAAAGDTAMVTRATLAGERGYGQAAPATVEVDLRTLFDRMDIASNIWIEPGDVVHVPEAEPQYFYVVGFVRVPGVYEIPRTGDFGVMDAVARARGVTEVARTENTYLVRKTPNGEERYRIDLPKVAAAKVPDVPVCAEDTIIVGTTWPIRIWDAVLRSIGLGSAVPSGAYSG